MSQIFRVERTKNYTVMSNHHFKNKNLSLKAKGLLSLMLSLPDKEKDQMAWVRAANQHRAIAEEIILKELIYI